MRPNELEVELEFVIEGEMRYWHLHTVCCAAWEFERQEFPSAVAAAPRSAPAAGEALQAERGDGTMTRRERENQGGPAR